MKVFIGYDPREALAFHVCADSIIRNASMPVEITPLYLGNLKGYEELHTDGSTEFVYSRFLVPALCDFQGWALYLDGDMVVNADLTELWDLQRLDTDVMVVKHDYRTTCKVKQFAAENEDYPRKNWSSVILWNCSSFPNRKLSPAFVQSRAGSYLHRFAWLRDDRIGELPLEWNWLVDEYEPNEQANLLHYTLGVPGLRPRSGHESAWYAALARTTNLER